MESRGADHPRRIVWNPGITITVPRGYYITSFHKSLTRMQINVIALDPFKESMTIPLFSGFLMSIVQTRTNLCAIDWKEAWVHSDRNTEQVLIVSPGVPEMF